MCWPPVNSKILLGSSEMEVNYKYDLVVIFRAVLYARGIDQWIKMAHLGNISIISNILDVVVIANTGLRLDIILR